MATANLNIHDNAVPKVSPSAAPVLLATQTIEWKNNLTNKDVSFSIPWAPSVFTGGPANKSFTLTPGGTKMLTVKSNPSTGKQRYTIFVEPIGPYVIAASDPEIEIK